MNTKTNTNRHKLYLHSVIQQWCTEPVSRPCSGQTKINYTGTLFWKNLLCMDMSWFNWHKTIQDDGIWKFHLLVLLKELDTRDKEIRKEWSGSDLRCQVNPLGGSPIATRAKIRRFKFQLCHLFCFVNMDRTLVLFLSLFFNKLVNLLALMFL
jgi:hypothetical protein